MSYSQYAMKANLYEFMIFGYTENFILMSIMLEYLVPPVFPDICVYTDIPADIVVLFNKQMVYD